MGQESPCQELEAEMKRSGILGAVLLIALVLIPATSSSASMPDRVTGTDRDDNLQRAVQRSGEILARARDRRNFGVRRCFHCAAYCKVHRGNRVTDQGEVRADEGWLDHGDGRQHLLELLRCQHHQNILVLAERYGHH